MTAAPKTPRRLGDVARDGGDSTPVPAGRREGAASSGVTQPGRVNLPRAAASDRCASPEGASGGHDGALREPRRWRIEFPAGMELLNANDRLHWAAKARITKALRWTAYLLARTRKIPQLDRIGVVAVYEPPDQRRRDPANLYPSIKACVDGLIDAGVCADDDASHLVGPDMRLGEPHPRGRIVLVITELETPHA